jgi:GNAT superfamily N-acetyltransferase
MYINLTLQQIYHMQLTEVTNRAQINSFHRLPFYIYQNDKNWIPYIKQDIEKKFNPEKNKLFKEGGKAIRWILSDNGKVIGRVAAFINPRVLNTTDQPTGGMGFFDCIDNSEAANILLNACKNWLQQQGAEAMDGPINFGERNEFWGLQIDLFNEPPVYPMNYNPPYYQKFFEDFGFKIYFEQYMFWRSVMIPAQPIFYRKYNQVKDDPLISIKTIRGKSMEQVAEDFLTVYNGAWGGHEHFRPMSLETATKLFKSMKPAIDPDIMIFVYYDGKPVSFFICLPELNQIFRYVRGNMNWMGKLIFLWHKWRKTPNRMTGLIFGVVKEWQGKGVEAAMIVFGEQTIRPKGIYKDAVLTWIGDFNPRMIKVAKNLGSTKWRTFYTYRYLFDRTKEFKRCPEVGL